MPSPAEEVRQALRKLAPARELAQEILRMEAAAQALIAAGDKLVALEHRRLTLEDQVSTFEVRLQTQTEALAREREERVGAITEEVRVVQADAALIRDRVAEETRGFIAARETDRREVQASLATCQRELAKTREDLKQAVADSQRQAAEEHRARTERRALAEAEATALTAQIADLRKNYREILDRVNQLAGR